ncbi:MAG: hypothetical protein Q7T82_08665 [Armatimonadota bacterium]|nr:hypothetical protein [Armatimonadota bacterium]
MRRIELSAVVLAAFAFSVVSAYAVTATPRPAGSEVSASGERADRDPRLDQKVTYEAGYKRLHQVTDDLSKQTGVTIYCGKNDSDWPVRDIPLVVCVRDMPLGKLLRLLALTTHAQYVSKKTSSQAESERTYRIYRTAEQEKETASLLQKRRDARLALADWSWEALMKLGNSPESVGGSKESRLVGKILACLGPDARTKVLAGDPISVYNQDFSQPDLFQDLSQLALESTKSAATGNFSLPGPMHAAFLLEVGLDDATGVENRTGVRFDLYTSYHCRIEDIARPLQKITELELAPPPKEVAPQQPRDEMPDKTLQFLKGDRDQDWQRTSLQAKVVLQQEGADEATFADLIRALSKATGFNIICEDFVSQKNLGQQIASSCFGQKIDAGATLRRVSSGSTNWFTNDDQKVLVGWSEGWRDHHSSLVSADYLAGLRKKLDGDGVDIDDICCFANMTEGQLREWIARTRDFSALSPLSLEYPWKLYDFLDPKGKALAKSEKGIPLGQFDPETLATFCRQRQLPRKSVMLLSDDQGRHLESEQDRRDRILSDPKLISTLVMRVKSELGGIGGFVRDMLQSMISKSPSGHVSDRSYSLEFEGEENGQVLKMAVQGPSVCFPIYSPEREAEILKEKTGKETK